MKHRKGDPVNGWLVIDKPEGMGSTEVVNLTRRLLNAQKNGHTGTLDPFALFNGVRKPTAPTATAA